MVVMLDLEAAVSRLEPALEAMRVAVRSHGGVVLKELGDGLSAVFGAPLADDRHATLACHAAIDLMGRIEALHDMKVRVGIHAGFVVASAPFWTGAEMFDTSTITRPESFAAR